MIAFDAPRLISRLDSDPEFRLASRHVDTSILLVSDQTRVFLRISGGVLAEARPAHQDEPGEIEIRATDPKWQTFLSSKPPPFFHAIFPAVVREEFEVGGSMELFFAYHGAIRRMFEVMRQCARAADSREASDGAA